MVTMEKLMERSIGHKEGQFGGALAFIGKDGWIEVEDHKNFHFPKGTDFTLACWVKITGDHAQPPMLIAKSMGYRGRKSLGMHFIMPIRENNQMATLAFSAEMQEGQVFILQQVRKLMMTNGIMWLEPEITEPCIYI